MSVQSLLRSKEVLPEGIKFFVESPKEFVSLAEEDLNLAAKYATEFTAAQITTIFSSEAVLTSLFRLTQEKYRVNIDNTFGNPREEVLLVWLKNNKASFIYNQNSNYFGFAHNNGSDRLFHSLSSDISSMTSLGSYDKRKLLPEFYAGNIKQIVLSIIGAFILTLNLNPAVGVLNREFAGDKGNSLVKDALFIQQYDLLEKIMKLVSPIFLLNRLLEVRSGEVDLMSELIKGFPKTEGCLDVVLEKMKSLHGEGQLGKALENYPFDLVKKLASISPSKNYGKKLYDINPQLIGTKWPDHVRKDWTVQSDAGTGQPLCFTSRGSQTIIPFQEMHARIGKSKQ